MVSVTLRLPEVDPLGGYFSERHHAQFLDYVCEVFLNPRFELPNRGYRELCFEVEGGVVRQGGELRGLIRLAKAHYHDTTVQVDYRGGSEFF